MYFLPPTHCSHTTSKRTSRPHTLSRTPEVTINWTKVGIPDQTIQLDMPATPNLESWRDYRWEEGAAELEMGERVCIVDEK